MGYVEKIWEELKKEADEILQELEEAMKVDPELRDLEVPEDLDEKVYAMIYPADQPE